MIRKSRTALVPAAVILPHFLDSESRFPEEKEDPLIHHMAKQLIDPSMDA